MELLEFITHLNEFVNILSILSIVFILAPIFSRWRAINSRYILSFNRIS